MKQPIVYGIPNCDTVKKTLNWFKKNKIAVEFHNYKTEGISSQKLKEWAGIAGIDVIFNKKSTTWKTLPPEVEGTKLTTPAILKLLVAHTSMIKRPVTEVNGTILVGFNEEAYAKQFLHQ